MLILFSFLGSRAPNALFRYHEVTHVNVKFEQDHGGLEPERMGLPDRYMSLNLKAPYSRRLIRVKHSSKSNALQSQMLFKVKGFLRLKVVHTRSIFFARFHQHL